MNPVFFEENKEWMIFQILVFRFWLQTANQVSLYHVNLVAVPLHTYVDTNRPYNDKRKRNNKTLLVLPK